MMRMLQAGAAIAFFGLASIFYVNGAVSQVNTGVGPTLANATIDLNVILAPMLPLIVAGIGGVIIALLELIRQWIKKRTGIVIEDARMRQMQEALTNAAGIVLTKIVNNSKDVQINVQSPAVKAGIEYVSQFAGDAVSHFGLTQEQIAEKIIAKVSVLTAANPDMNVKNDVKTS